MRCVHREVGASALRESCSRRANRLSFVVFPERIAVRILYCGCSTCRPIPLPEVLAYRRHNIILVIASQKPTNIPGKQTSHRISDIVYNGRLDCCPSISKRRYRPRFPLVTRIAVLGEIIQFLISNRRALSPQCSIHNFCICAL